jgi:probable F420-dependent oxidoreductase
MEATDERVMRFSVELPIGVPEDIAQCAEILDGAGIDACFVTDHPAPSRSWLDTGGHVTVDPFVALATAAAVTRTLRVHTHCLIPAYRDPLLTAKAVATLDAISDGRVILGVAVGYLEAEFAALGVPFAERFARFDAALVGMKRAWAGADETTVVLPPPVQRPHPPIWVGGNTAAAMRRAIEHGDGWAPFPASTRTANAVDTNSIDNVDTLARAIARFRTLAADAGRDPDSFDICFAPFSHPGHKDVVDPDVFVAEARALAEAGVTWLTFHFPKPTLGEFRAAVETYATEAFPKVRA